VNELAAMPTSSPSTRAATATTPLGKLAKALSKIFLSVTGWITITRSTFLHLRLPDHASIKIPKGERTLAASTITVRKRTVAAYYRVA
jgi:hypothetical protein